MNWENVIPVAIPMKRAASPKPKFNDMHPSITEGLQAEAKKTSQLFRDKVAADLARALNKKSS